MRLTHISIQTGRIDEEISFYERFAELKVTDEFNTPSGKIVFMGNDELQTEIELLENPKYDKLEVKGISIGFSCHRLEDVRDELRNEGFHPGEIREPNERVSFFFVKSPTGVTVQFIEYKV